MTPIRTKSKKKVIYQSKFRPKTSLHKYSPCLNKKKQEKNQE